MAGFFRAFFRVADGWELHRRERLEHHVRHKIVDLAHQLTPARRKRTNQESDN